MKIDSGASFLFAGQQAQAKHSANAGKTSFDAMLTGQSERAGSAGASSVKIEQADFTNMTRQELRDWMSEQLQSGQMTADESSAFLGFTVLVQLDANGRAISGGADDRNQNERVNFFEAFQSNMEFHRLRGDSVAVARVQAAIDRMYEAQGQITRFDARI